MSEILIFTDLHLGIGKDNSEEVDNAIRVINEIESLCKSRNAKRAIFLGDLFHNRKYLNVNTLNVALDSIHELSKTLELWFILGNHDIHLKHTSKIHSLKFFEKQFQNNPKIHLVSETTKIELDGKQLLLVPWLGNVANINEKFDYIFGHINAETNSIKNFFAKLKKTEKEKIDDSLIHAYLSENEMSDMFANEIEPEQVILNNSSFKTKYLFDLLKDKGKIFSGHFHIRDSFERFGKAFYWIGSPLELTWSDEGNEKGFYFLNVATDKLDFIANNFSPKHIKIHYSNIKKYTIDKTRTIFKDNKNNYIKFIFDEEIEYNNRLEYYNLAKEVNGGQNVEFDTEFFSGLILTDKNKKLIHTSKFDFISEYINTIDEIEFKKHKVEKNKLLELLKNYFVGVSGNE